MGFGIINGMYVDMLASVFENADVDQVISVN